MCDQAGVPANTFFRAFTEIDDTVEITFYRDRKKKIQKLQVGKRPKQLSVKRISANPQPK